MRKILSLLLLVLPLSAAFAQPAYSNHDTVTGTPSHYYVPFWYTNCPSFRADSVNFFDSELTNVNYLFWGDSLRLNHVTLREFNTNTPMEIFGIVALVDITPHFPSPMANPTAGRAPEYLKLLQGTDSITDGYFDSDSTQPIPPSMLPLHMTMLDSLRWDTVTPHILRLPKKHNAVDDTDFFYCYAYECWFPQPVTVDSVFYVLGTYRSNCVPLSGRLSNYPTSYFYIGEDFDINCDKCIQRDYSRVFSCPFFPNEHASFWHWDNLNKSIFGLFYPIIGFPNAWKKE
ncbi:MAG: hypothetical protein IJ524_07750 [Bacteroidales bacterium]|nr:hypothetical protein [Bacteroidales bacterium]